MTTFEEIIANGGLPVDETADVSGGSIGDGSGGVSPTPSAGVIPDRTTIHNPTIIGGFLRNTEIDIKNTTGKNIFNVKRTGASVGDVTIGDYSGGSGALWDYSAGVFSVKGTITATLGEIGGWTIGATTLTATSIILDSGNERITVGTSNEIIIDGANKKIESDNYVSGAFGSGFHIDENLGEFGNIACRGLIRTSCFQKDTVNVMGGNFAVLDGDVLDEDMTILNDSTLTTKGTTTFIVGDVLRIKNGDEDEWLEVTVVGCGICDSYSEDNKNSHSYLSDNFDEHSQSFTGDGKTLNSCKFYLKKEGYPVGNAVVKIYAHTGTWGSTGLPTGSALAISENLNVSTIPANDTLMTLSFTGANRITLINGTHYCVVIEYSDGDNTDRIGIAMDSSGNHSGNTARHYKGGNWSLLNGYDAVFYIYTGTANNSYDVNRDKASQYGVNTNPAWKKGATVVNYGQSGDGGVYMTASESNAPYLSVFTHSGSPWTDLVTRLRLGNLNGYLGYSTDLYGIGIGDTTHYLKYDPTNHLRIRGDITADSGTFTGTINATAGKFGTATNYWSVGATGLTAVSASGDVIIKYGKTNFGQNATNGFILGYDYSASKSKFEIGSSSNKIFTYDGTDILLVGGTITATTITGGTVRTASGNRKVQLSSSNNRLEIYNNSGTNIGYFGNDGANGNFMYLNQPDTNQDHPPFYITSAQDSNAMNCFNTNSSIANRPAFRFESNNSASDSPCGLFWATGGTKALYLVGNSTTGGATLYLQQDGTAHLIYSDAGAYLTNGGVWTDASSKKEKENFENIKVLDVIKNLDVKKYNYISEKRQDREGVKNWMIDKKKKEKYSLTNEGRKTRADDKEYLKQKISIKENTEIEKDLTKEYAREIKRPVPKHISPMAEDFYEAFGIGDDKGISPKDLAGVALQAIKELTEKVEALENKLK